VFQGKAVLDLIQDHQKTARIGTKTFEYAELRGTSEFTSMAASTASGDGTSLLRHLKKNIVGRQDCETSKLLQAIRKKADDTKEAVPFGPNGTAVDCSLYTADAKGQTYGVGNVAFTHIAPSDLLEEEGWLSADEQQKHPKKKWKWALLSDKKATILRKKVKIGEPREWAALGGCGGRDRSSTIAFLADPPSQLGRGGCTGKAGKGRARRGGGV